MFSRVSCPYYRFWKVLLTWLRGLVSKLYSRSLDLIFEKTKSAFRPVLLSDWPLWTKHKTRSSDKSDHDWVVKRLASIWQVKTQLPKRRKFHLKVKTTKIKSKLSSLLAKPAQGGDRKMRSYGASSPSSQATDQLKIDTIVGTIRKRFYILDWQSNAQIRRFS